MESDELEVVSDQSPRMLYEKLSTALITHFCLLQIVLLHIQPSLC